MTTDTDGRDVLQKLGGSAASRTVHNDRETLVQSQSSSATLSSGLHRAELERANVGCGPEIVIVDPGDGHTFVDQGALWIQVEIPLCRVCESGFNRHAV